MSESSADGKAPVTLASDEGPPAPQAANPSTSQPASGTAAPSVTSQPATSQPADELAAASQPADDGRPRYAIEYKFEPGTKLYYIIDNEYRDHGGVPSFGLTFTTTVHDRMMLEQRVVAPAANARPSQSAFAQLEWEIDRYEIHEKAMTEDNRFDSLRELYPKAQLRGLGNIPGARVTFSMEPNTGRATAWRIINGPNPGPRTSRKMNRTTEKCLLNDANLRRLLDDLGPLFLPGVPKAVGESWTAHRRDEVRSAESVEIDYTFTLRDVRETGDTRLAIIEMRGDVKLDKTPPTPKPGQPIRRKGENRDFVIERALCQGRIEFDIDAGRLVRMELRRELDLMAHVQGKDELTSMDLISQNGHRLRVETSTTPPARPVVVGEKRAPVEDPEPVRPKRPPRQTTTQPARPYARRPTTQPAGSGESTGTRFPTTQPAGSGGAARPGRYSGPQPTSRPARPATTQPAGIRARPATRQPDGVRRPVPGQRRGTHPGASKSGARPVDRASARPTPHPASARPPTSQPAGQERD